MWLFTKYCRSILGAFFNWWIDQDWETIVMKNDPKWWYMYSMHNVSIRSLKEKIEYKFQTACHHYITCTTVAEF